MGEYCNGLYAGHFAETAPGEAQSGACGCDRGEGISTGSWENSDTAWDNSQFNQRRTKLVTFCDTRHTDWHDGVET